MNDFLTLFLAVFLGEIASLPVKKFFTPQYDKILTRLERIIAKGGGKV